MNILSWAALAVLTYCALRGWRRGLIMTVFSMFATVIAIAISAQLSPQLSRTWQNTAFYEIVSERVEMTLFKGQDSQNDGEESEDNRGVINSLPLPDVVQNVLASNDDAQNNMLGVSEFRKYIADSVTGIILNAISFVLVFVGVSIIMRIIIRCLNLLSRLPVIHTMNKMGGMLVGLLKGLTQTMLPMAPPITCIATINIAGSPRRTAAANCSVENNVFDTVAEPEIKAPITPMSGDTTM